MRHLTVLFVGSLTLAAAACASSNNPPAASSATVAQATSTPNTGPNFAPVSNDGLATAPRAVRNQDGATQPAPDLNPASSPSTNGNQPNGAWAAHTDGSAPMNPTTGNATAAPADRPSPSGTAPAANGANTDADNSRVNRRDRNGSTLTPMDQGPSEADRKITRDIRQALMGDSTLSFTAKNVKIITIDGKVTLRGPVKTEAERTAIEAKARKVVGNGALVDSQLELAH